MATCVLTLACDVWTSGLWYVDSWLVVCLQLSCGVHTGCDVLTAGLVCADTGLWCVDTIVLCVATGLC